MIGSTAEQAGYIAAAAVDKASQKFGVEVAKSLAIAFLCAWAVALKRLLGPKAASEIVYQVADQVAAPEEDV
ncbi:hypothetical protein [Caulobacter sp. Root343]|uniref:hypothetical protein n=1 Tax=Caulobacter sp. Root343 TaxID=1736520 RepID=UPI0006F3C22C|nr:hypothetical protein [Caulobacter sp. Root343]KQV66618.1 hypothetical protein ASC70_12350 [Caulobacter sp. Root343]